MRGSGPRRARRATRPCATASAEAARGGSSALLGASQAVAHRAVPLGCVPLLRQKQRVAAQAHCLACAKQWHTGPSRRQPCHWPCATASAEAVRGGSSALPGLRQAVAHAAHAGWLSRRGTVWPGNTCGPPENASARATSLRARTGRRCKASHWLLRSCRICSGFFVTRAERRPWTI